MLGKPSFLSLFLNSVNKFNKTGALMKNPLCIFHSFEPVHEISNNVVCATSKGSDQPAHTCSLIRAFASRLNILFVLNY